MSRYSNITAVIQARTGSSRLPGKVLLPLYNEPLLFRLYERIKASKHLKNIIVGTTTLEEDDKIETLCSDNGIMIYRGHPSDLIDRHLNAALSVDADAVVKIPSDCPLISPSIIDKVIEKFISSEIYDYVSNLHPATYPDGNDVEIMSIGVLKTANNNAVKDFEREHTTPYIWENRDKFRVGNVEWESGFNYSMTHRWTLDYYEDYLFIKEVYNELYPVNHLFELNDILDLLTKKPELELINKKYNGVNWYRHHLNELKTISPSQTRII